MTKARPADTLITPLLKKLDLKAKSLLVTVWASIDNVVFLFAPVRFTPGQEGALHHAGRALVLMLLRMVAFTCVTLGVASGFLLAYGTQLVFELSAGGFNTLGAFFGCCALVLQIVGLVALGAFMLRRFDVSKHAR